MQKGIARVVLYLLLVVPLLVVSILIVKQIQFAFDLRRDMAEGTRLKMSFSGMQQIMAANELATRSFFLSFFCFLMILCGLLITLKATENAFTTTKETRVKYSLRTAYPGLIMAILGCVLLAFSVYRTSEIQFITTRELVKVQVADSLNFQQATVNTDDIVYQAPSDTATDTVHASVATAAPLVEQTPSVPAHEEPKKAMPQKTAKETIPNLKKVVPPTDADILWANNLALRTVAFGYYPTVSDKARYTTILCSLVYSQESGSRWDRELHWAFKLLQKTQKGYSPSDGELKRFESIIGARVASRRPTSAKEDHVVSF